MRDVLANVIGFLVLAAEVIIFLALPLCRAISGPIGLVAYVVLAGMALYVWHSDKVPAKTPSAWLIFATVTVLVGAISFAVDVFVGSSAMHGPVHSFLDAAEHAGSHFGFPLTVLICPCLT